MQIVGRWCCRLADKFVLLSFSHIGAYYPLEVDESLPAGSGEDWLLWRALNRMRTGVGHAKTVIRRWGQSRRRPVGGLRLRGATDDGPPPLLPSTR